MHFPRELMALAIKVDKQGDKISADDWGEILSKLKKALHPYLQYIANKPLGDLNLLGCFSGNTLKNEIKPDNSNCDCVNITIRTPGLWFPAILMPNPDKAKPDCIFVWGISRDDEWVLVSIVANLCYEPPLSKNPNHIKDFEVEFLRTAFSWPLEIRENCGISLEQMYEQILKAVSDWAQRRKELADEAACLNTSLKIIDAILHKQ